MLPIDLQLVLDATGDLDPATGEPPAPGIPGRVELRLPAIWAKYALKAAIHPALQALYVERDCYKVLLGIVQDEVNVGIGQGAMRQDLSDRAKTLRQRYADTQTEIQRIEARTHATRGIAITQLTTTAPVDAPVPGDLPDPLPNDANSPVWSGSPYFPDPFSPNQGRP